MNGSSSASKNVLKTAVKENSSHFLFWTYALRILSKMHFLDPKSGNPTRKTYVIQHIQSTIRGYMEICKKCFDLNLSEISIRYLLVIFTFD